MQITAELSLYPLHERYLEAVVGFIRALQSQPEPGSGADPALDIVVNQMSTQVRGELDAVQRAIGAALTRVHEQGFKVSLVVKYLNTDLPIREPVDLDSALASPR